MAQFYTLEEAARVLGMSAEELKAKAQSREVRAFLDGGSWRFRVVDVDELARRRGLGSDAELRLSDLDAGRQAAPASSKSSTFPSSIWESPSPIWARSRRISPKTRQGRAQGARRHRLGSRHSARRPHRSAQSGHGLELSHHRRAGLRAAVRAIPTSGSCPTPCEGRAIPTCSSPRRA